MTRRKGIAVDWADVRRRLARSLAGGGADDDIAAFSAALNADPARYRLLHAQMKGAAIAAVNPRISAEEATASLLSPARKDQGEE